MKLSTVNLLLLGTAAGLFSLLAMDENREQTQIERAIEHQPALTTLDPNAIRTIRLNNPDSGDIVLKKTDSGWQMKTPVNIAADLVQVADLLALAGRETRGSVDIGAVRLADLGLQPPQHTITLDDTVIAIGTIEPLKRSRYVMKIDTQPDRQIRLVDDFPIEAFDGDFTDLVNKALLPYDALITRIDLPKLSVSRDASTGSWRAEPASDAATADAIKNLIDAWHTVRAVATMPPMIDSDATKGADVSVTVGSGQRFAYRIVDKAGARFLQRLDVQISYQLAPADSARLLTLSDANQGAPSKHTPP